MATSGDTPAVDGQTPDVQQSGQKQKGKSDDKCIGNRRVRTIILCAILLAFTIFAFGYLWELVERENTDDMQHGANLIFAGLIFSLVFLIVTLLLLFVPKCNPSTNTKARLPGVGLLLGALMYIFGWVLYITAFKDASYDFLSSDEQEDMDAFCKTLLPPTPSLCTLCNSFQCSGCSARRCCSEQR